MKRFLLMSIVLMFAVITCANCTAQIIIIRHSDYASRSGGWRSITSAPHDGTYIEVLNAGGIAPTYGIFRWTDEAWMPEAGSWKLIHTDRFAWVEFQKYPSTSQTGFDENIHIYWRPYTGDPAHYQNPTGGAQNTNAYWCAAVHMRYDRKRNRCY